MKWIDYREMLGIGFVDEEKAQMFANRLSILVNNIEDNSNYGDDEIISNYFIIVCEKPEQNYAWYEVENSIRMNIDTPSLISKGVALAQAFGSETNRGKAIYSFIEKSLDNLNIQYEIREDTDGRFIFPKGAAELDEANVNMPLQWLSDYPKSRKAMELALRMYAEQSDPSNTADQFRKTLETFAQEFFGTDKNLENHKKVFGVYLKDKGVPKELVSNFETTLQMYTNYMNDYAKHKDRTSAKYLEFIMYQTGNIIRFVISLEKAN